MKPTIEPGSRLGWLTLGEAYQTTRAPGRTGQRWLCVCWCGADHDVSRESLVSGRVRACRKCAKAYRAQEDEAIR